MYCRVKYIPEDNSEQMKHIGSVQKIKKMWNLTFLLSDKLYKCWLCCHTFMANSPLVATGLPTVAIYFNCVKVNAVPLLAMQVQGRYDLGTRWGWVLSVTPRLRFTPRERTPDSHWVGGCVGFGAGLDTEAEWISLCHCQGPNPVAEYETGVPTTSSLRKVRNRKKLLIFQLLSEPCSLLY
jgi:hypothetical protein